jgi:hypothetical protein
MGAYPSRPIWILPVLYLLLLSVVGCELDEVTLAEPEDIPVVEAYIMVGDGQDQVSAFLHWTLSTRPARDLLGLTVMVTPDGGPAIPLFPEDLEDCVIPGIGEEIEGVCYTVGFDPEGVFQPGQHVELEIFLYEDDVLRGGTTIPEDIAFIHPRVRNQCALSPGETLEFSWNRSAGVWAYTAETQIGDLKEALAMTGVVVETDSVALQGVAVSDSDTTIVFPTEFGVLERFTLEQEVALALQGGLPLGADADVVIAAVDQNYVNWVRGGNFNPSGPVRVSSLRGPGVGVFGSVVRRTIRVRGGPPSYFPGSLLPECNPAPPP